MENTSDYLPLKSSSPHKADQVRWSSIYCRQAIERLMRSTKSKTLKENIKQTPKNNDIKDMIEPPKSTKNGGKKSKSKVKIEPKLSNYSAQKQNLFKG